ncbi:MAG: DUF2314 domain-containing protein [Candidatus Doudnabacteria bacterium]|nr:DUF2314 domain-containing protein [Candidatus Doudnabacteria bacterium]
MSWMVEDATLRHQESPGTFQIPSKDDIKKLHAGNLVKLIFTNQTGETERMWVEIKKVLKDRREFEGVLDNDPVIITELAAGSKISFLAQNIASIWED